LSGLNGHISFNDHLPSYYQESGLSEKDGLVWPVSGKRDLMNQLKDKKLVIKDFIRKNNVKISRKNPDSFVPVLEFYDSFNQ